PGAALPRVVRGWRVVRCVARRSRALGPRAALPRVLGRLAHVGLSLRWLRPREILQRPVDVLRLDPEAQQRLVIREPGRCQSLALLELPQRRAELLAPDVVTVDDALPLQRLSDLLLGPRFHQLR